MAAKKGFPGSRQAQPQRQGHRKSRRSLLRPIGRMNSYSCFVQTCREELQKSHPGTEVSFAKFSKHCAHRWKALSLQEKAHFQALAQAECRSCPREMRSYNTSIETKAPKTRMSAFLLCCQEYRPQLRADYPNLSLVQESRCLRAIWRGLCGICKKEYQRFAKVAAYMQDMCRKDVEKYRKSKKIAYARSLRRESVAGKRRREEEE
ncbi:high mobility group protein B1-like [Suncus etruscus]|uniref:high mobility group protein B1-like n=1 Tax=Suncus etruscus TaxID=109475 RepID=UPI00210F531D|nr:high mobility group protein B1-like [Suncus etruscus]